MEAYTPVEPDGAGGWQVGGGLAWAMGCAPPEGALEGAAACSCGLQQASPSSFVWRWPGSHAASHAAGPPSVLSTDRHLPRLVPSSPAPQLGGQAGRWILYHHAHLVERCFRTMKALPGGLDAGSHPLTPHAGERPARQPSAPSVLPPCVPARKPTLAACGREGAIGRDRHGPLHGCMLAGSPAAGAAPQRHVGAALLHGRQCARPLAQRPSPPVPAEWAVPHMLRIVASIHALYTPAGRQALAPVASALEMAPQERALYLRRGPIGKAAAKVRPLRARKHARALAPYRLGVEGEPALGPETVRQRQRKTQLVSRRRRVPLSSSAPLAAACRFPGCSLRKTAAEKQGMMATPPWAAPSPPRCAHGCATCGSSPTRQVVARLPLSSQKEGILRMPEPLLPQSPPGSSPPLQAC